MKLSVLKVTVAALLIALGKSQDIPDGLNPQDLLDYIDKRVENFCPTGFEKCECVHAPGNFTTGPFNFKDDLLGSLLTMMGCNPGFCFCNDAKEIEVDIRDQALKEVMDLCPRGEMDRCLCKDNTKILWPFTQFEMLECAPKKCKCKGDKKPKTLTRLGCAKGGIPKCPGYTNGVCRDGTIIDTGYIFRHYVQYGTTGCLCPDGFLFKCEETGVEPLCPDGKPNDWSLGGLEDLVKCNREKWWSPSNVK